MKLEIFSTNFRKILKYKISWKSSIGSRVPCSWIDQHRNIWRSWWSLFAILRIHLKMLNSSTH